MSYQPCLTNYSLFRLDENSEKGLKYRALYYKTKNENTKLKKDVQILNESLNELKEKFSFSDETIALLSKAASHVPVELFERTKKKIIKPNLKESYPSTLRTFAFTLHLYSPAAYR